MSSIATPQAPHRAAAQAASPTTYDPVLKSVHWATALLVAALFGTVWAAHAAAMHEQHEMLIQLHRSFGLTVLGLTVFRLAWRRHARVPRLPADLSEVQLSAARAVQALLYALLIAQPLLGLVHSNAGGVRVDFFFLGELPAIVGHNRELAHTALAAHEIVAIALLVLIGLHTAAALFHHFVRRDDVLKTMLPRFSKGTRA
jgi:cytochrome b561